MKSYRRGKEENEAFKNSYDRFDQDRLTLAEQEKGSRLVVSFISSNKKVPRTTVVGTHSTTETARTARREI